MQVFQKLTPMFINLTLNFKKSSKGLFIPKLKSPWPFLIISLNFPIADIECIEWSDLRELLSSKKTWLKIPKFVLVFFISKKPVFVVEYENVGHINEPFLEM